MENPYDTLLQEIRSTKADIAVLLQRIPNSKPVRYYSPKEIAENTPLGVQTIRSKIKQGLIKAEKLSGRKYMISEEEFHRVCKDAKSLKYKRD